MGIHLLDPLVAFNWATLHDRYDNKCRGYRADVEYLDTFEPRPPSDRALYYVLAKRLASERVSSHGITLGCYEGMLYWKSYSNPQATLCKKIRQDKSIQGSLQSALSRLSRELPRDLPRNVDTILEVVRSLDEFRLYGMRSPDAFPVRTTFLHFIYPEAVPVFDKMTLRAIGIKEKNANRQEKYLRAYIPHAWYLAEKYSSFLRTYQQETPLRLIEMALWVTR